MPSTYNSTFWFQRTKEAQSLSEQMIDEGARQEMTRLARKYEQIALRGAHDEARIAFDSAREALRVSQDATSLEQIASIRKIVDAAWDQMQKAGGAMKVFRRTNLLIVDGVEVIDSEDAASSTR